LLATSLAVVPALAMAESDSDNESHEAAKADGAHGGTSKESSPKYFFGFTGVAFAAREAGETHALYGAGAFYEMTVIHHWLDFEIAAHVLSASDAIEVPIDILLKKPISLGPKAHGYFGVGPTFIPVIGTGDNTERRVDFGIAAALGAYIWFSTRVGLSVSANYNLVWNPSPVHEFGGKLGVIFGI
jgi:hypothetical protein